MKLSDAEIRKIKDEVALWRQREKIRKRKIGKKVFPANYNAGRVHTGSVPMRIVTDHDVKYEGRLVYDQQILNPHGRVKSVVGSPWNKTPVKNNTFMQSIPATKWTDFDIYVREWASTHGSKWGVEVFHHIRITATVKLFFYATEWFFEKTEGGVVRRSKIYSSRDKAMNAFNARRVYYFE